MQWRCVAVQSPTRDAAGMQHSSKTSKIALRVEPELRDALRRRRRLIGGRSSSMARLLIADALADRERQGERLTR